MKTSKIFAVAALSLVAAIGTAQAEQYQGVTTVNSTLSRAEVQSRAIAAAQGDPYSNGPNANAPVPVASGIDRQTVRAGAVAAAHDGTANLSRGAFANSVIPAQYTSGSLAQRRAAL